MGKIKESIVKNKALIIILLVILAAAMSIINVRITKADEKQKIDTIKSLISEGSYEEAVEKIEELNNKYSSKTDKKIADYRSIITIYIDIYNSSNNIETKEKIEELRDNYSEILKENIFEKLNNSIDEKEKAINEYLNNIEQIKASKEKISEAIESDIESVQALIEDFKGSYPEEDISEIENKYKEKLIDIEKKKAEKEKEETKEESNSNNKDENNNSSSDKLKIADTMAAQSSSQIITVVSNGGSYGELVMWEKDNSGNWREVDRVGARLGQNGMKSASEVYEMDKCTPTGIYTLTEAFGINENPGSGVPYRKLDGSEYWVDDVDSQYYNTMQFGEAEGRWNSAEKLVDFPGYYNYSLVIDYNRWPVVPGKSSAIFLHCDMGIYTYGCVAIPQSNLINLLTWLNPASNPVMILDFDYTDVYNNY